MSVFDLEGNEIVNDPKYISFDAFEPGSLNIDLSNGLCINSSNHMRHRTQGLYKNIKNKPITVRFNEADIPNITKITLVGYSSDFSSCITEEKTIQSGDNFVSFAADNTFDYFKILVFHSEEDFSFRGAEILGDSPIERLFNPNKESASLHSIPFNYPAFGNIMGSGRLLLPPNYGLTGKKVPLVVYVHGSGGIPRWESALTENAQYRYLTNEGFAFFDCFPWTNKISFSSDAWSPFQIPLHIRAYLEGVKYVCSRFNVDIDNVVLLCKSQGGNIGHWAAVQTDFNFRAVGLLAPTTDPVLQKTGNVFYNSVCRDALTQLIDFEGTETEKSAFVSSGNLSNATVVSFLEKNKGLVVALMPYARGIFNAQSVDELYDGGIETIETVPQWLLDLGLSARQSSYDLIPKFAEKSDYAKTTQRPVRFWCAADDAQTSTYGNYAIYRYMLNGGSDAEFTMIPNGTGGHNAMDNASEAIRVSGTTSLGIAYSDIAKSYVEIAAFFHRYV